MCVYACNITKCNSMSQVYMRLVTLWKLCSALPFFDVSLLYEGAASALLFISIPFLLSLLFSFIAFWIVRDFTDEKIGLKVRLKEA